MSNFSYDDFAVLVRKFNPEMLSPESLKSLRIVPLSTAPSIANAIKGTVLTGIENEPNLPREKNGTVVTSNVTVQHGSAGYCRLVGHIEAVKPQEGLVTTAKAFVLYHIVKDVSATGGEKKEVIAVASLKEGFEIGDVCYPSFTITTVNNYQSVAFNPNAFATVEDLKNINGLDGLHIAFDTASGDLKLLDKDGNVLDQANLPIKADVIIADGEEGYKYVKTDVKQDIHAAKAWMPEGSTAWEAVGTVPYTRKHAALVVGKGSSRVFVCDKPTFESPISTESVPFEHVVIDDSTYLLVNKTATTCTLRKVKGKAEATLEISAGISEGKVTHGGTSYTITNDAVEVDVIKYEGVTYVLVGPEGPGRFKAQPISGKDAGRYHDAYSGIIVTFGGSTTASRVFVDQRSQSGSYPISTEPVNFDHVEIGNSIYMLTNKNETGTTCTLRKVKGEAGEQVILDAVISGTNVTLNDPSSSYTIDNGAVKVDVIKGKGEGEGEGGVTTTYVLVETGRFDEPGSKMFQAWHLDGTSSPYSGIIVTSEGSSADRVLGITTDGTNLYTFDENAETPSKITSISGGEVRWLDTKPLTEVPNHNLKYGLEAFVWTVKGQGDVINEPFFQQLNASLLALGFHEGDDIALGTNLATLAPAEEVSPLNGVDADDYIHGKNNKATREQEVDEQRKFAQDELVAWNAQHPALTHDRLNGTRISSDGVDIRHGKIEIGNGIPNEGEDSVKRYVIETDIDDSVGARTDKGLQIGVMDSGKSGNGSVPIQKDILTINAEDYISGAPTCLALLKCSKSGNPATVSASLEGGRITANFYASGAEVDGAFKLTITDTRKNNDFGNVTTTEEGDSVSYKLNAPRIVEIIPVYKSGADAQEAVPAQRSISAIVIDTNANGTQLTIKCSQVIDWAQSIDLGVTGNGMELYLIVKVY